MATTPAITPEEIRELCQRVRHTGMRMRNYGRIYCATLQSGLTFRAYCTEEEDHKQRSTIVEGPSQLWVLVIRGWNYNYETRISRHVGGLMVHKVENLTFEVRGDMEQFLQDMTLCRLFGDLEPDDDVRMAS